MASHNLMNDLLDKRPTPDELSARGILSPCKSLPLDLALAFAVHDVVTHFFRNPFHPGKMDPSLQQATKSLEMHMKADQVQKKLASRPTTQALVMEGVLRSDLASVAPALHGKVLALESERRRDGLKKALQARPELGELQQQHKVVSPVVSPGGLAPSLASAAVALDHNMKADKIASHLRDRAAIKEKLERNGIMSPSCAY